MSSATESTPGSVPPKPTGVSFDEQGRLFYVGDAEYVEITQTVTWQAPRSEGIEIRVYGVTECVARPASPEPGTDGPCLVVRTPVPESIRTLLAIAPASAGIVSWTWTQETGCDIGVIANPRDGPYYVSVVLAAYGPAGHSIFAIAEPGGWWEPLPGDMPC